MVRPFLAEQPPETLEKGAKAVLAETIVDVRRVSGEGGRHPTLVVEVRNVSDTTLRWLYIWSRFHLGTKDAGWSETMEIAGTKAGPLASGESRRIVLASTTGQGLVESIVGSVAGLFFGA